MGIGPLMQITAFTAAQAAAPGSSAPGSAPATAGSATSAAAPLPGQTAVDYLSYAMAKMDRLMFEDNNWDVSITRLRSHLTTPERHSMLGEKYLIAWLLARGMGISNDDLAKKLLLLPNATNVLDTAINYLKMGTDSYSIKRREYWFAHLAIIFSNELDNPDFDAPLKTILKNDNNWQAETDPQEKERKAREQIEVQFLNGHPEFGAMRAENLFRLALLAKNRGALNGAGGFTALLAQAKSILSNLATATPLSQIEGSGNTNTKLDNLLVGRKGSLPPLMLPDPHDTARTRGYRLDDLRDYIAGANELLARITMIEAGELNDPQQILNKLKSAEGYLRNTGTLDGLELLDAKKTLAENLILQGFMERNLSQELLPAVTLRDFQEAQGYLNGVKSWESGFSSGAINYKKNKYTVNIAAGQRSEPNWLAQISVSSQVWTAKLTMVLAGEINHRTDSRVPALLGGQVSVPPTATTTEALTSQKRLLESAAAQLTALQNATFSYSSGAPVAIIKNDGIPDLKNALAENYARQAFINKQLGNLTAYNTLMDQATTQLKAVLANAKATPQMKATANFWLAKVLLVRSGDKGTFDAAQQLLASNRQKTGAEDYARAAIDSGKLSGALLSSAYQTYAEILSSEKKLGDAQQNLERALQLYPLNLEARADRGDVLSWQGRPAEAKLVYDALVHDYPDHLLHQQALLGQAEAAMRNGENYSADNVSTLETRAFDILRNEPVGSFLIPRAIEDLMEAYSTNEDNQPNIILIANILLNRAPAAGQDQSPLEQQIRALVGRNIQFTFRFKAQLYLHLAEATSWLGRDHLADALSIVDEGRVRLNKLSGTQDYINSDTELKLQYAVLDAELKMRKERDLGQIDNAMLSSSKLVDAVFASRDPDLVRRIIFARIEGLTYGKKYDEIVALVRGYISAGAPFATPALGDIERMFSDKGRQLSFNKFKISLWKKLADALNWNKDYGAALAEYQNIYQAIDALAASNGLPAAYVTLTRAEIELARGEVLTAQDNYDQARLRLDAAVTLLTGLTPPSKESKVALAQAEIGLGDLYRYAQGLKDPDRSQQYYTGALTIALALPQLSDDRALLLTRIYLGQSKLAEMSGNPDLAAARLHDAQVQLALVKEPYSSLVQEINNTHIAVDYRRLPTASVTVGATRGYNGRSETQVNLDLEMPVFDMVDSAYNWRYLNWLQPTLRQQTDLSSNAAVSTTYLGARLYMDTLCRVITSNENPLCTNGFPLTLGVQGAVGTVGAPGNLIFYRRPDLMFTGTLWWKYLSLNGAVNVDTSEPKLNTYYAGLNVNPLAGLDSRWANGLGVLAEYNHFYFNYLGNFDERDSVTAGLNYRLQATDWLRFNLRLAGVASYVRPDRAISFTGAHYEDPYWLPGLDVGVSGQVNIWKYFQLNLSYDRQQNREYPLDLFQLGLRTQF